MSMMGLSTLPGSPESSRQISAIGTAIGIAWLAIHIGIYLVPWEKFEPYLLGSPKGFLLLQLLIYPFVHRNPGQLVLNFLWLLGIVNLSMRCLSADGFIRVLSIGTVGGGPLFLLMDRAIRSAAGEEDRGSILVGGDIALVTILGALMVLESDREVYFLGDSLGAYCRRHTVAVAVGLMALWLISMGYEPMGLGRTSPRGVSLLLSFVAILYVGEVHARLWRIVAIRVSTDLFLPAMLSMMLRGWRIRWFMKTSRWIPRRLRRGGKRDTVPADGCGNIAADGQGACYTGERENLAHRPSGLSAGGALYLDRQVVDLKLPKAPPLAAG